MTKWRLTWGDASWTEDDLTVGHFALAQEMTRDGWDSADPLKSPAHAANLLALLVASSTGRDLMEVAEEIAAAPAVALINALSPA